MIESLFLKYVWYPFWNFVARHNDEPVVPYLPTGWENCNCLSEHRECTECPADVESYWERL
jgi:hypothetical protein